MLKGKKNLILIGILVLLAGTYAIVELTKDTSRSKSLRAELVNIDTAVVTEVRIMAPGEEPVTLNKKSDGWMVQTDAGEKPTRSMSVEGMLNTLNGIKPSRLASRTEDKWQDFQVDSAGTRIIVKEGSEEVLDLILGRFGVEGQRSFYSYVRLENEKDTYVAADFMKMSVSTKAADYRNNIIARITKDSLVSVAFDYPDSAFSMTKENGRWVVNGQLADSANTVTYLNGLSYLTSKNFIQSSENQPPLCTLTFSFTDQDDIQLYGYNGYVIGSTENRQELFADQAVFDKVFKGQGYFTGLE